MTLESLIIPTGKLAFLFFLLSLPSGIKRLRSFRLHIISGSLCLLFAVVHCLLAMLCGIYEPLGILASAGIIATSLSGIFRLGMRVHVTLALITLMLSAAHIVMVMH